jgi:hypothetical protein
LKNAYDGDDHANEVLPLCAPGCKEEQDNCHWDSSDGNVEFSIGGLLDYDEELNFEAKEKEEVEFEESNVNLAKTV